MRSNLKIGKQQMLLHVGSVFVSLTAIAIFFILDLGDTEEKHEVAISEGFNMNIPEPENNSFENSKLKAIISEQNRLEEERSRRKMQNNSFDLLGSIAAGERDNGDVSADVNETGVRQKKSLADFEDVEAPKTSSSDVVVAERTKVKKAEKSQSRAERLEKLRQRKAEEIERKKASILERYGVPAENEASKSNDAAAVSNEQVVPEVIAQTNKKNGFKSLGEKGGSLEAGSIRAVVHGEQKNITSSSQVKLRILDQIEVAGSVIPPNTMIIGKASFSENRVFVTIENIAYKDNVYPFKGCIYDRDGFKGIYIPDNLVNDAGKEGGERTVRGVEVNTGGLRGLLDKSANALVDATKSVVGGAIKETKVTLPANYKLIIKMTK
jgi:conjugative transposon TraM protein